MNYKNSYQDFCIFPSASLTKEEDQPIRIWAHPYIGLDISKKSYEKAEDSDACNWSLFYYNKGKYACGYSMGLARCLTKHRYGSEPKNQTDAVWSELPGLKLEYFFKVSKS